MAKIEKVDPVTRKTIQAKTKEKAQDRAQCYQWWNARSKKDLVDQLISTASYLKTNQNYRIEQASRYSKLYGNQPIVGALGQGNKISTSKDSKLPADRPTMNVIQSCVDTLVSRLSQARPRPQFLTDNGDYKQRNLGKNLNHFMDGELYRLKAHQLGEFILRDGLVIGDSFINVFERDGRVAIERCLATEFYEDPNDALYGEPRTRYRLKLIDRAVLAARFPEYQSTVQKAEQAYPDNTSESTETVSDQVMVVEAWHLPSAKDAGDGRHAIVCSAGEILDEEWTKDHFPQVKFSYSPRMLGTISQGLVEQLQGTQVEINRLLITITRSINLVGVPRIFIEKGSKIVKAHFTNEVGGIVEYTGTMPQYNVAPCMPAEVYAQLQRLVDYAYQQSGISALSAASQKPAGLDSGKALREFDDIQSDRFAALERRYHNVFIDLAYLITDKAKDIAERDGKYATIYPNKDGTREIDLPKAGDLTEDAFVIQCFDSSMLPRDPAGRKASIVEDMQAGLITPDQGRRLLDYPDLEQDEKLANANQERILSKLDQIVHEGKFTPPDPFMDIALATKLVTQYYNLYEPAKLEQKRLKMLRDFFVQVQGLKQAANPPAPAGPGGAVGPAPGGPAQAVPSAPPVSDMLPNAPGAA